MTRALNAAICAATLSFAVATPGLAQDNPLKPGNYSEVAMIDVADGAGLQYASYLANEWRKAQEFAKSKGWIVSYAVFNNVNSRPGEPDLYLSVTFPSFPDAAEDEKRDQAYREFMKRTDTQLAAESGDRAKYRTVLGSFLLRELKFR